MVKRKDQYGQTHLLRGQANWCHSCRQSKKADEGKYQPLPGGLRQRWICDNCNKGKK